MGTAICKCSFESDTAYIFVSYGGLVEKECLDDDDYHESALIQKPLILSFV